jgi:hypothetical protein
LLEGKRASKQVSRNARGQKGKRTERQESRRAREHLIVASTILLFLPAFIIAL